MLLELEANVIFERVSKLLAHVLSGSICGPLSVLSTLVLPLQTTVPFWRLLDK